MSSKYRIVFLPSFSLILFVLQFAVHAKAFSSMSEILKGISNDSRLVNKTKLLAPLQTGAEKVRIIVSIERSARAKALATANSKRNLSNTKSIVYNLKDKTVKRLLRDTVSDSLTEFITKVDTGNVQIRKRFTYTFGFAATVTAEGLEELLLQPDVISVSEDIPIYPHTRQGIPLINSVISRGMYDGSGTAIAIIDTGIDSSHPKLGNSQTFPNSKVIGGYDTGDDDADPRPDKISGEAHGTACAGIAAGDFGTTGDYVGGVAPGAKIYALKITEGDGRVASASSLIAAWEWCVTHQYDDPNNPILVISTSFGGGRYFSTCDGAVPGMTQAAAHAISAGITLFISSGNDGYCDSLEWPACISTVNAVGAVYDSSFGNYYPCVSQSSCAEKVFTTGCGDYNYYAIDSTAADSVTSYSNSATFLTLFAPANMAYSTDIAGPGGYGGNDYVSNFGGTSASCPYAAGAAVVLKHAAKIKTGSYLQPNQVQNYFVQSGDLVTDGKTAVTKARINLDNAISQLPTGTTYSISVSGEPNGSIFPSGEVIVAEYGEQAFTIQADSGYAIKDVKVDSESIGPVNSYIFHSVTGNHTISATFKLEIVRPFPWLPIIQSIISSQHQ